MLFKAPTQTPHFQTLLDDMPTVDLAKIAKHLAMSIDNLKRWANDPLFVDGVELGRPRFL